MSTPGRPNRGTAVRLGGKARSAKEAPMSFYCELACSETSRAMMMAG
jgi:hypothetical protein